MIRRPAHPGPYRGRASWASFFRITGPCPFVGSSPSGTRVVTGPSVPVNPRGARWIIRVSTSTPSWPSSQTRAGEQPRSHSRARPGVGVLRRNGERRPPTFVRTPGMAERLDAPQFPDGVLSNIPVGRDDERRRGRRLPRRPPLHSSTVPCSASTGNGRRASPRCVYGVPAPTSATPWRSTPRPRSGPF